MQTADPPNQTVYDVATLTQLALDAEGKPSVIQLSLPDGEEIAAHGTDSGLRLITVVTGDLYWGDGDAVDPAAKMIYPTGSVLMLPSITPH
ncbi:hypothetical protein C1J03_11025 [Sulfitobacter sp. SK012]|uniref:hypothetical protein n=1 Tax=Sulfitobacter sp. SK012 TaxID=1389005 RepID=UPI000E0AED07|nr:hypothetical protein [Sulfitobacter sp. SK012]AXI46503.1 hypothetical protein C1J03_11025 [Sulfitobacter sp. SK012]